MPDLLHTLQGNDLGFMRIVAEAWGIDLNAPDAFTAIPILVKGIKNCQLVSEVVESLPAEARQALQYLMENEARLPWALFCRRFGELRLMGPGKRDRERPDLQPASAIEVLWYRALIGKAFMDLPPEPQEYAYIPDDLLEYLSPLGIGAVPPLGRPATPLECAFHIPVNDRILDHACTLLAARRAEVDLASLDTGEWPIPLNAFSSLLQAAGLLDAKGAPKPEAVRAFLEASRSEALAQLASAWMKSKTFNELRLLPGLLFEGQWQNDALLARQAILEFLSQLPQAAWWSLPAFISAVKEQQPDFQRPAGDYDSWFIRLDGSETYLRGFTSWDRVDGALIRFLISGPLHWLGILDLAAPAAGQDPTAFRPSLWAARLWHGSPPEGLPIEDEPLRLTADGRLRLPALTPRSIRYQIARFCEGGGEQAPKSSIEQVNTPQGYRKALRETIYHYRLTPVSLGRAAKKGLRTAHLISLLRRHSKDPIPPNLLQSLERWESHGVQAQVEKSTLLRVASPEILETLRQKRAARFLGEVLNPTTVVVKQGGEEAVRNALAEMGYLAEIK